MRGIRAARYEAGQHCRPKGKEDSAMEWRITETGYGFCAEYGRAETPEAESGISVFAVKKSESFPTREQAVEYIKAQQEKAEKEEKSNEEN